MFELDSSLLESRSEDQHKDILKGIVIVVQEHLSGEKRFAIDDRQQSK
jgi:hypothetical protein